MDPVIEVTLPASNTAAEWNANIVEGAEKAGVEIPGADSATVAAAAAAAKTDDTPVIYEMPLTINGKQMVFRDANPENLLKQIAAANEAAQPAPVVAAKEEPKPVFTDAELFDISIGLQKGDPTVLKSFIVKSGVIREYLESEGVNVADLKKQVTAGQSAAENEKWKEATEAFKAKIKAGESDYPGGAQNTELMGFMLATLNLGKKPSVESFEEAYAEMKKRGLVFPATAKTAEQQAAAAATTEIPKPKKIAPSSTALGTHGHAKEDVAATPKGKVELDISQLSPRQYTDSYNELIARGYKSEQIIIKQ
jgi:hypothetical protein